MAEDKQKVEPTDTELIAWLENHFFSLLREDGQWVVYSYYLNCYDLPQRRTISYGLTVREAISNGMKTH